MLACARDPPTNVRLCFHRILMIPAFARLMMMVGPVLSSDVIFGGESAEWALSVRVPIQGSQNTVYGRHLQHIGKGWQRLVVAILWLNRSCDSPTSYQLMFVSEKRKNVDHVTREQAKQRCSILDTFSSYFDTIRALYCDKSNTGKHSFINSGLPQIEGESRSIVADRP